MKSIFVFVFCSFYSFQMMAQDIWVQKDSVNGPPKGSCVSFVVEDEGFIATGLNLDGDKRSMFSYNPNQDDWDDELSIAGEFGQGAERSSAVAFTIRNKAYVGTGKSATPFLGDFWEYDHQTKTWTQKANFGGTPRRQAVAFSIDSLGYVGTGEDVNGVTNDFWAYNPNLNSWSQISNFPGNPRKQAVGLEMGNKGYVLTGYNGTFLKDMFAYNPELDSWEQKADFLGSPRYGATGFKAYPYLYVGTGYDNTLNYTKDMYAYNLDADQWNQKIDFGGTARVNAVSFVLDGIAYLGTGYNGFYLDDFYSYNFVLGLYNEEHQKKHLVVYPQPAKDHIYVENVNENINLYTISGSCVTDLVEQTVVNTSKIKLNLSQLNTGVYIYRSGNYSGKILVN
ncbi:MAG: Kelch repeat-containing protein [Lishizhenia sp.]